MTGNGKNNEIIHFLILGNSKVHILRAIDYFDIKKAVIFTSENMMIENQPFIDEIEQNGVNVIKVVLLSPFEEKALENMSQKILKTYELYSNRGSSEVIAGLTGGTNLMALAMGMLCLSAGLKAHYVLNNEVNDLIEIDYFKKLWKNRDLSNLKDCILEGVADE
ncbi:hypothetical protein J2128_000275 [Methanomicrobium sp. W14]|uniref:hypothetical protein n=1 Tax=Methanomicrobium sp. W14 TaxID=2817839 RepID=UPI001AE7B2AE|nr:hypothetical protein [Methanomicrobium sp. W14]MBP2132354.1 hypothetical protein [Methanomicrobium sp. W14]